MTPLLVLLAMEQGMFERHAVFVQEEVAKLRRVAETQQNEIQRLQKQLQLEKEDSAAKGTAQVRCSFISLLS